MKISLDRLVSDIVGDQTKPRATAHLNDEFLLTASIQTEPSAQTFYIDPDLKLDDGPSALDKPFCLISAPAAVGKTAMAAHLLEKIHPSRLVIYVPLRNARIGNNYFSGLIGNLFPRESRNSLLAAIFGGDIVFIFDGYDEVSMTSEQVEWSKGFSTELRSLYEEHVSHGGTRSRAPSVLFLFRSVFAQLGVFEPLLPHANRVQVEFFSESKRRKYLENYIKHFHKESSVAPKLASALLEGLETTLASGSDEDIGFLGHAIVLSAFGDFVAQESESNTKRLINDLQEPSSRQERGVHLLTHIVTRIVTREVDKFPAFGAWNELYDFTPYTTSDQDDLLVLLAQQLSQSQEHFLEHELREAIESYADSWLCRSDAYATKSIDEKSQIRLALAEESFKKLRVHPFVDVSPHGYWRFRNPIYFEYYLARFALQNPELSFESIVGKTRVSPYFAFFFLSGLDERFASRHASDLLFFLMNIVSAGIREGDSVDAVVEFDAERTRWGVEVSASDIEVGKFFLPSPLQVYIPNGGTLSNASILSDFHVEASSQVVRIRGPEGYAEAESTISLKGVHIASAMIELDAVHVNFDSVFFDAELLSLSDRTARVVGVEEVSLCGGDHDFLVTMSDYLEPRIGASLRGRRETQEDDAVSFGRKLGRVFLWFRKHRREQYGVYNKRFATVVTRRGRDLEMTMLSEFLYKSRILLNDGELVVLDQSMLETFGVYYLSQNKIYVDAGKCSGLLSKWNAFRLR